MTDVAFDWSKFNGAYGSAADLPQRLLKARTIADVDELRQSLAEVAVFGLDNGYLTKAAAPLVALLVDEALIAAGSQRPAWPYLCHVLLSLGAGREMFGLCPTRFFSPEQSEAERVQVELEAHRRRRHIQREVTARAGGLAILAQTAAGRDATYAIANLHVASALGGEHAALLAGIYERLENDAQRATLLLPCAAADARVPNAALRRILTEAAAGEASAYLKSAAWSAAYVSPGTASEAAAKGVAELQRLVVAADRLDDDYVWYEGLLSGVLCQAIARSSLPRAAKLDLFYLSLRCESQAASSESSPLATTAAAAAWQVFALVFARRYQSRRPLDHSELDADELAALRELRATFAHWLEVGHQYPSQFGIPEFNMCAEQLLEPLPALARELGVWPAELGPTSALVGLLRPLAFPHASDARSRAFALLADQALDDLDVADLTAILIAASRLPAYPCRELALAVHRSALDRQGRTNPQPPLDLDAFRRELSTWAPGQLTDALGLLFTLRSGKPG